MAVHGIIGKKVGMTQLFAADGTVVPVTVVQAGPCLVVQKKTADKDGYDAVQIGLVDARPDRAREQGRARARFEKAGVRADARRSRKCRLDKGDELKPGDKVLVRHVQGERPRRRDRHVQGQGVQGRGARATASAAARRRTARCSTARPGSIGAVGVPVARFPGHALARAAWADARSTVQEPRGRARRRREEPALHLAAPSRGPGNSIVEDRALELRRRRRRRAMAKIAVCNWKQGAGRRGRPARRRLRLPVPQAPGLGGREGLPGRAARRDAQDEGPLRGLRLRQEALQAEGHRTRAAGRQPSADPPPRRHRRTAPCRASTRRASPWARRRTP